jgi:CheY-like chemotaxis protein
MSASHTDHPITTDPAAQPPGTTGPSTGPVRLLLVEDERPFRELLESFLRSLGYAVETVVDGQSAVRSLQTQHFDLLITDLCMPRFDGMELLTYLKKSNCPLPIIAMSGGVGGEMVGMLRAARLLGARQTLTKPFALADLASAVRGALCPGS